MVQVWGGKKIMACYEIVVTVSMTVVLFLYLIIYLLNKHVSYLFCKTFMYTALTKGMSGIL